MADSKTISSLPPALKSMQYEFLRSEGLRHIEKLAGNIWTDYNIHDPGISILEVLSYVITDLGYRSGYSIPDILAQNPDLPPTEIKNFYTARQILPVSPVTFNDYRKLLIDVEVHHEDDEGCTHAGVKNAWIEKSHDYEVPVYKDINADKLTYIPVDPNDPQKLDIRCLYDIILEFDRCEKLGDLNENTVEERIKIYSCAPSVTCVAPLDPKLSGLGIKVQVEFPRWDNSSVDWNDLSAIKAAMKNLVLDFDRLPSGYDVQGYGFLPGNEVWLDITKGANFTPIATCCITEQLDKLISDFSNPDSLVRKYQQKIFKIQAIVCEVRKTLMANRNLCEDFFRINALKVEEIALCTDLIVSPEADIEQIEARMYFEIGNFLAPTPLFYTLDEMYAKGYRTEEIFEGPRLNHGFMDDAELEKADRKKSIHVSDLINIIMDIEGVLAVKNIQIANIPLDNIENIPSQSVKWCLQLAFDKNYVPRLSTDRSSVTFFKDQLPYISNEEEVDTILADLIKEQRPQKLHDIPLDLPVPQGEFKNSEDYYSLQEEFPLVYGIGSEGLPSHATVLRKAQAKQLKAFLVFFDQLLADYLSQLAHVKDLFSMNKEKDANGDFVINKSYFSQSLIPSVPDILPLLDNPLTYPDDLQAITEDLTLFQLRRNKFLDHLMARFCEQFTDYALLVYRLDGKKAPEELLTDKLEFLNAYPEISCNRFRAFNYESPCHIWHIDNESGLEDRISLLTGINPEKISSLMYSDFVEFSGTSPNIKYYIPNAVSPKIISLQNFSSIDDAKAAVEEFIINAVNTEHYKVVDNNGVVVTDPDLVYALPFHIGIICGSCDQHTLAYGKTAYNDILSAMADIQTFMDFWLPVFENEYYNNPESNRRNLTCPLENYFSVVQPLAFDLVPDPPHYYLLFDLFQDPFVFGSTNKKLLTGKTVFTDGVLTAVPVIDVIPANFEIIADGNLSSQIFPGSSVKIKNSSGNDGNYFVFSVTVDIVNDEVATIIQLDNSPVLNNIIPLGEMEFTVQTAYKGNGDCKLEEKITAVDATIDTISLSGDFAAKIFPGDAVSIIGSQGNDGDYSVVNVNVIVIGPGQFQTDVQLNATLNNLAPFGNLKYNKLTFTEFKLFAEAQTEKNLFEIALQGTRSTNYVFSDYTILPYTFNIIDECGDIIATSVETDFNAQLAVAIANHQGSIAPDEIAIVDSTFNDNNYTVFSATAQGENIRVEVNESILSLVADGLLQFGEAEFVIQSVDQFNRQFVVNGDLARKIFAGEGFTVYSSALNNGSYTIKTIAYNAPFTTITVNEKIPSATGALGKLSYIKQLPVVLVEKNTFPAKDAFYVKGGADEAAVNEMIAFMKQKFFSHEGMHIIENVLLRPKYNGLTYVKFTEGAPEIDPMASPPGFLIFKKKLQVENIDPTFNMFFVSGDITTELSPFMEIIITGSTDGLNDGKYTVITFGYNAPYTGIKVMPNIKVSAPLDFGELLYDFRAPITSSTNVSVTVFVPTQLVAPQYPVSVHASLNGVNDGNYLVQVVVSPAKFVTQFILVAREMLIQDKLLPVNLLADCLPCRIDDPYSFILSVILPAWQGRFANQDFRTFFDRAFRTECPAHLVPNICWISCEQMKIFEEKYKRWLIENQKKNKNPLKLSNALNELIDILSELRSQYPEGTLHDCAVDDTLDNAIILNKTVIGTN